MGMQPHGTDTENIRASRALMTLNTLEGRKKRKAVKDGVWGMHRELHALVTAMGQWYQSTAVYGEDEEESFQPGPREAENPFENYDPCTYLGRRLPHAQFLDPLYRHWILQSKVGSKIKVVRVGVGLEWVDVYFDWDEKRGVEEDGCVLVRPDFFVAWRAHESGDETIRSAKAMMRILGHA
ncbi:hypothetical protein NX059_006670 [Plenodomus lindquistii]|nr:hypothetical protein NX059_006670 [Plenodomus lindquistii]